MALAVIDPAIHWLAAAALAVLFLAAATGKVRDLAGFRAVLADYRLLPPALVPVGAPAIVVAEAALALALCVPSSWPVSAACALGLLGAYTAGMAVNLARGRTDMDCGCLGRRQAGGHGGLAGALSGRLSGWLLVRNGLVMLLAGLLLLPASPRVLSAGDAWMVLAGVLGLALAYRVLDQLIANHVALQAWLDGDA